MSLSGGLEASLDNKNQKLQELVLTSANSCYRFQPVCQERFESVVNALDILHDLSKITRVVYGCVQVSLVVTKLGFDKNTLRYYSNNTQHLLINIDKSSVIAVVNLLKNSRICFSNHNRV